jgi:hypothetical protein
LPERSSGTISSDEERVRFTPVKEASNLQTTDIKNQEKEEEEEKDGNQTQPNAAYF